MEAAGVEEQDIAGFKADWDGRFQERLVFGDVSSEKQGFVKTVAGGSGEVGSGEHLQAAVVGIFRTERHPDVDEVAIGE